MDASDASTIQEVTARLEADGYTGQFATRADASVVCFTCRDEAPAAGLDVATICRLEGASDPADMLAVAAVTCPGCGAKGTLVLNYGADATPEDDDVLAALKGRGGEPTS